MNIDFDDINEPIKFTTRGTVEHGDHTHTFWYETEDGDSTFELNEFSNDDYSKRCELGDLHEQVEAAAKEASEE